MTDDSDVHLFDPNDQLLYFVYYFIRYHTF